MNNNVGMNTITQKGSLPIEDNILDGYVVHKITHVIDGVIKETSRDPNFTATDPGGDPRAVNTFFGFPNSRADIAMLSAFQQTVGFYLKESYNEKLQTFCLSWDLKFCLFLLRGYPNLVERYLHLQNRFPRSLGQSQIILLQ